MRNFLKISKFAIAFALTALAATLYFSNNAIAAESSGKVNIAVECRCTDPVGKNLCSAFRQSVQQSQGYQLVEAAKGFGMAVHFSCVDLWQGIDSPLAGSMSAVSVAFTIYADGLPGEVYEDSSVFRVGKDATAEMSRQILAAVGQLVNVNSSFFDRMRAMAKKSAPPPSP